jgi:hypothetical protein
MAKTSPHARGKCSQEFSRRHRISGEGAKRDQQAEKIGAPEAGLKILLEVLLKKQPRPQFA